MSKIYSLSELKSILNPVFSEHGVRKAVLFGSYAKGTATEHSDVAVSYTHLDVYKRQR